MLNGKWTLLLLLFLWVLGSSNKSFGQQPSCGTPARDTLTDQEIDFSLRAQNYARKNGVIRTIPIVVHVVYAESNDVNNISDSQIASQFPVLNDCFRGRMGGVDTEIEFCLAGINRVENRANSVVGTGTNRNLKTLIHEDPNVYLNCWVVNTLGDWQGCATYADDLAAYPELDGIVICDEVFGTTGTAAKNDPYHLGKIMVHEAGHWLNLYHVFDGGCEKQADCAIEGDLCCDTPPQSGESYACNRSPNSCHRDEPDRDDPIENYMGYGYDECITTFTTCQSNRMNLALDELRPKAWFTSGACPHSERNIVASLFPNPFRGYTTIRVEVIGKVSPVSISVYDSYGKMKTLLDSQQLSPGVYDFPFETSDHGLFFVCVRTPWRVECLKAISQ